MAHAKKPNKSGKHNHRAKQFSALGNGKDSTNLKKALRQGDVDAVVDVLEKETNADKKLRHAHKLT